MNKGKRILKRSFCVILAAGLMVSMASCNKKNQQGGTGNVSGLAAEASNTEASKEAVYRFDKEIALGDDLGYVEKAMLNGDQIIYFASGYSSGDDYEDYGEEIDLETEEADTEIAETEDASDAEGNTEDTETTEAKEETEDTEATEDTETSEVTEDRETTSSSSCAWKIGDKEGNVGNLVVYTTEYPANESQNFQGCELLADGNLGLLIRSMNIDDGSESYFFVKVSLDGKELSRTEIDTKDLNHVERSFVTPDGSVALFDDTTLTFFNQELKKKGQVRIDTMKYLNSIIGTKSGRVFAAYLDDTYSSTLAEIFPEEGKSTVINLGNSALDGGFSFHESNAHDLEGNTEKGVKTYDINGTDVTEKLVMDYMDSDIISNTVNYCLVLDEETVLLIGGYDDIDPTGIYKKVPADQIKDKKIITMGSIYSANSQIKKHVLEFNKASDEYKIRLYDYEDYYTDDDFSAPERQFRNDILSGTGPDIIITSNMFNPGIYMNKNVFEDLNPYFEKSGINKDDYLANILEVGTHDGKLYTIYPSFSLAYVAAKSSILEGRKGLTMQEVIDLEKKYDCEGHGFASTSKGDLLSTFIAYSGDTYYDTSSGECHFDSEEFVNVLKWVNEYPVEDDTYNSEENYFDARKQEEMDLRKNKALFKYGYLYDLRQFKSLQEVSFGEEIDLIGFPGAKDNTSGLISTDLGFAINSKSENKDAAFDFIKYYISEDYQMPEDEFTYSMPIMKKALDKFIEYRMQDPVSDYGDNKGETYKYTDFSYSTNKEVETGNITEAEAQKIKEFIYRSTNMPNYDQKVQDIITEEAAAFFNGQKSAEDVAKIIQSRVTIYVQENQ